MQHTLHKYTLVSLGILSALTGSQALADDSNVENIVVIGKYAGAKTTNLAGSYEIVGRDQIANLHVDDNVELFTKLPGISVSRYNQGPINADLSIRGFDGDGGSPHAKLLIDGVPANLHNGFGELDQLFPLGIDSIQAFKGTSDARFGLFNIAGNYQVFSRNDIEITEVEATLGSYDTAEVQAYTGQQTGELTHNYSFGYRQSEGYRDNTDLERYALSGRWFYDLGQDTKVGYIARYSYFDADAPGYLSLEESRQNPKASASYASEDGGDKTVFHHSLHIQTQLEKLSIDGKLYYQTFERERWVRFSEAGSLQNRYDDQEQLGLIVDAQYDLAPDWQLLGGVSYQSEDVIEQRFGTVGQVRQRDTNNVIRNYDYTLDSTGVYVSLENQLNKTIEWNVGIRADKLDGDFAAFAADGTRSDREIYDFGWIVQPKFNVFYRPLNDLMWFFNFGESFQHPFGSSLFTTGDVNARDVSTNVGWELGTSFVLFDAANVRLSVWRQDAEDEFVLVDGVAQNVGETERSGWEAAVTWGITDNIDLWANYSSVDSDIVNPGTAGTGNIGNELRSIPEYSASIGIDAALTERLSARLHVDSQGDYYVNEANLGGQFGDYTLTHLNIDYAFDWALVSFNFNNIFDEYYEYVYDFSADGTATIHSPGDGRNFSVSARFSF